MNWLASTFRRCSRKRRRDGEEGDVEPNTEKLSNEIELGKDDETEPEKKRTKTAFQLPENISDDLECDSKGETVDKEEATTETNEETIDETNDDVEEKDETKEKVDDKTKEKVDDETTDETEKFILTDLKVGDQVDTQDKVGHYIPAEISEINEETGEYKIHYIDYDTKYDDIININTDGHRIVKLHSISLQKSNTELFKDVKKDSKIDISVDGKWFIGTVLRFDTDKNDEKTQLCQVQVKYKVSKSSKASVYWFNINDTETVAPLGTHTKK